MLNHSAGICNRNRRQIQDVGRRLRFAIIYLQEAVRRQMEGGTVPMYRRTNARIYDKVERSQEETPKRDSQSASPDIIAARRKAGPGRTTRKRGGKSPVSFQPS